jgi:hypothetical protein
MSSSMLGSRGGMPGDKIPKGYRQGQMQQFTPDQMNLFKQMFGHVSPDSYTSRLAGGDQSMFDEVEAPAMRQFSELLGGLSSRFSAGGGQGSLGNRRSSGFQNTATSAASNFAQDLQAQRQSMRQQAIKDLMGMSGDLLGQRPQEKFLVKKQQKQGTDWGGLGGAALGGVGGFFAGGGNPMTAMAGANAGYNIGSGIF